MKKKKVNYLNNRDMLKEIHRSKISFCHYDNDSDSDFDLIVHDLKDIEGRIEEATDNRINRISNERYRSQVIHDDKPAKKLNEYKNELKGEFGIEDLVFRLYTYEHIPEDLTRKKTHKTEADSHVKLNFIPFKHYRYNKSTGEYYEVLKSHWDKDGFCLTHGSITNKLAKMFMMLTERYSQRGNWRGYTYLDEMKSQALLQFSGMGLRFNEEKSENPFSYYTQLITTSFTKILNTEKKNQKIRDDLLEQSGQSPSISRQIESELKISKMREEAAKDDPDMPL